MMTKEKCKVGLLTDTSEIEVTSKDWDHIIELVNEIKLDKIHSLEAPSDDRSTDRKMIAVVIITLGNKVVYTSSSFDDGNPPHQLKNLIEKLFAISKIDK
ncbi:MAG: hypothetical protein QNJ57_00625 [Flavobacteriaceae bacterium]|nr:hypothetical protein [Flavobacteriaceae bacterium]